MRGCLNAWTAARLGGQSVAQWQLAQLNETLALARARSPFYRAHLPEGPLPSLAALPSLPMMGPETLRAEGLRLLCVRPDEIARIVTLPTSGSTGAPKRVYFTAGDLELCTDFFHHGMQNVAAPGQTVAILFPHERPGSVGDQLIAALQRFDAKPLPLYGTADPFAELVCAGAECVVGAPGQVLALARQGRAAVSSVLLSADYVSPACRAELRARWSCTVYEHYGMTEMGLGGGVSCDAQAGYHMRDLDLLIEIVDPATGAPLPDGQTGEVVFTTLTRAGMPFIRYRTGDRSVRLPGPCPCGCMLSRLARVGDRGVRKGGQ